MDAEFSFCLFVFVLFSFYRHCSTSLTHGSSNIIIYYCYDVFYSASSLLAGIYVQSVGCCPYNDNCCLALMTKWGRLWYDSSHLTPVDSHRLLSSSMQLILALVLHVARCPLPFPPRR